METIEDVGRELRAFVINGFPSEKKLESSPLIELVPDRWFHSDRAKMLMALMADQVEQMSPRNWKLAAKAALCLPVDEGELGKDYADQVQAWREARESSLKDRIAAFRQVWDQRDGDQKRRTRDQAFEAGKKWWESAASVVAKAIWREAEDRDRLGSWDGYRPKRESAPNLRNECHPLGDPQTSGLENNVPDNCGPVEQRDVPSGPSCVSERPAWLTGLEYIRRPKLEAEFCRLVNSGAKLIAICGFPGMGKTSLARVVTNGAPLIGFKDGKPIVSDIQSALVNCGLGDYVVTEENAVALLVKLMYVESDSQFIVLDNLQRAGELRGLVPSDVRRTVVATCRELDDATPSWCRELQIDVMELEEAVCLVNRHAPSLNDLDAIGLACELDSYPLMIEVACGRLNCTGVEVQDLCASLRRVPGGVKTKAGEKLRVLLADVISSLRDDDPLAVQFLACAAYAVDDMGWFGADDRSLYYLLREIYGEGADWRALDIEETLNRLHIARYRKSPYFEPCSRSSAVPERGKFYLYVHPFVKPILRDLLKEDKDELDRLVWQKIDSVVSDLWAIINDPPTFDHLKFDRRFYSAVFLSCLPADASAYPGRHAPGSLPSERYDKLNADLDLIWIKRVDAQGRQYNPDAR